MGNLNMGNLDIVRIAGIVLIVAGTLGLAYGSFSFTKETHQTTVGPVTVTMQDKETVNIPVWAGVASIAIGAALLLMGSKRS